VNGIRVADIDGDGVPEVVVALGSSVSTVRILSAADRSLLWESPVLGGIAGANEGLAIADADGDGRTEILVGTQHTIRLFEYDTGGEDTTPPVFDGAPGIQTVAPSQVGCCPGLELSWGLATDAASPPVAYRVYRGTDPSFVPAPQDLIATTYLTSMRDAGVAADVAYSYVVRAVDAAGNEDANTAVVTATYPHHVPLSIVTQPQAVAVCQGSPFALSVAATGSFLTYTWWSSSSSIPVGTGPTYSVASAQDWTNGVYYCVVSDGCSIVKSASVPVSDHGVIGDVNGNCKVDVADIFFLIDYLFAGGPYPSGSSDADGDGVTNVEDVLYLIAYLFAGGPPPVVK
jgi:hypothetical protein